MPKITGLRIGQIEITLADGNGTLGQVLRDNNITFADGVVIVDGVAVPASSVDSTPVSNATQQIEVAPAAKGGRR